MLHTGVLYLKHPRLGGPELWTWRLWRCNKKWVTEPKAAFHKQVFFGSPPPILVSHGRKGVKSQPWCLEQN